MKCKRLNEVIELLQPAWQKEPELNLIQILQKLAKEAGYAGELSDLSDDILIYHLKMRDSAKEAVILYHSYDYRMSGCTIRLSLFRRFTRIPSLMVYLIWECGWTQVSPRLIAMRTEFTSFRTKIVAAMW